MKVFAFITYLILLSLPFFYGQFDARIPYIIFVYVLILSPLFIKEIVVRKVSILKDPSVVFFIFFLLFAGISTCFSKNQSESLVDFFLYCSYFVVYICSQVIFVTKESRDRLLHIFLGVISALSIVSLYNTLVTHYATRGGEIFGFMWMYQGHNHLVSLLLFALPICFYFLHEKRKHKLFYTVIFLLLSLSLLFSFSLGAVLSLIFAGGVGFFTQQKPPFMLLSKYFLFGVILFIFSVGVIFFLPSKLGFKKYYAPSMDARQIYWVNAIQNGLSYPFTGTGFMTFRSTPGMKTIQDAYKTSFVHNFFLQMLSDTGILGFFASLGLIFSVLIKGFIRCKKEGKSFLLKMVFIGLLASTVSSLLDIDWQLPTVFVCFWLFVGILFSDFRENTT